MPDCYAKFGNQRVGYGFSYSLSIGFTPGTATISCPPNAGDFRGVDDLDIYFKGARFLRLVDARFASPTAPSSTTQAPVIQRQIEDRRWKWQFGEALFGNFNEEQENGQLLRERSPRDLAKLCFAAMGDPNANVNALPETPRPRVLWVGSRPVDELDRLCSQFGCAPAYDPFDNTVFLVKLGDGGSPPNAAQASRSDGIIIPASPDSVRIIMGPTLFQSPIKLTEPVGLDVDGKYRSFANLSYTPQGGWGQFYPGEFDGLGTTYTDPATGEELRHRDLAKQSIWRAYRFGLVVPAVLKGTKDEPKSVKDIGPFTGDRLDKDPLTGERMPVAVRGVFADKRRAFENSKPKTFFPGTATVNGELRIVTFSDPVFKRGADGESIEPADLELLAAFKVSKDGVPINYNYATPTGRAFGSGELIEHHDELVREVIEAGASTKGIALDNRLKVSREAAYYADAALEQFADRPAATVQYNGLRQFRLDGNLRSIEWRGSTTSAPSTSASWNAEVNRFVTPYEQRASARAQRQADYANRRAFAQSQVIASRAAAAKGST